jgi:urease gamma subunit
MLVVMLAPREIDKLAIYVIADLARRRRDRGTKLNSEEAVALICEAILEGARDGKSVAELMTLGRQVVAQADCMDGVTDILHLVQVEATFPDGTKLVSVHDPVA